VRTVTEFNAATEGTVELKCTRSRYGDIGREWTLAVGGGTFDVPAPCDDEAPGERAARKADERYEAFARGVIDALRDGPLGRDELFKRVKGARAVKLREWLARLVADPARGLVHDPQIGYSLGVVPTPGPRTPKGARAGADPRLRTTPTRTTLTRTPARRSSGA
jgi:hypothetical protein